MFQSNLVSSCTNSCGAPLTALLLCLFSHLVEQSLLVWKFRKYRGKKGLPPQNASSFGPAWPALSASLHVWKILPTTPRIPVWERNKLRCPQPQVPSLIHVGERNERVKAIKPFYTVRDETQNQQWSLRGKYSHRIRMGVVISGYSRGFKTLDFTIVDRSCHHFHFFQSTKGNRVFVPLKGL